MGRMKAKSPAEETTLIDIPLCQLKMDHLTTKQRFNYLLILTDLICPELGSARWIWLTVLLVSVSPDRHQVVPRSL